MTGEISIDFAKGMERQNKMRLNARVKRLAQEAEQKIDVFFEHEGETKQVRGRVGMSEKEARASGRNALMATRPMRTISRAREKDKTAGTVAELMPWILDDLKPLT